MSDKASKLHFPRLQRIALRSFSLFSSTSTVDERVRSGVFCLAGANGLGKSTFLSAANFALTGLVPNPEQKFKSVEEYYRHGREFAREYFAGRVDESDRESAEVEIEFAVGPYVYALARPLFDAQELSALTVRNVASDEDILDTSKLSRSDRNEAYEERLVKDVGLASFEQFVFLQHFVMTFDERRHLLFWDSAVLEQALFLAFGVNYSMAKRADSLTREYQRADSLARNANWQATEVRKRINELRPAVDDATSDAEDIVSDHKRLTDRCDALARVHDDIEGQQRDLSLRLSTLTSAQVALRTRYEAEFASRIRTTAHLSHHPIVVGSIAAASCNLCGTASSDIASSIRKRVAEPTCPLCASAVDASGRRRHEVTQLKELDQALAENRKQLAEVVTALQRIERELVSARDERSSAASALKAFEKSNYSYLLAASHPTDGVGPIRAMYQKQMDDFLTEKRAQYQRRDEKKRELRKLQDELEKRYADAESKFVPRFKELALKFLGIDLDVRMDVAASPAKLVLEVRSAARRHQHQLSESQRFFVDIALRMAFAQFMSANAGEATLFIDTPEGSLDIAYESRAGEMLAMFVESGGHVVMTANINSSRLLHSLATRLGESQMHLCRMTSWTELSEVQIEEEDLFTKAFGDIEKALRSKRTRRR